MSGWGRLPLVDLGHVAVGREELDSFHSLEHEALVNDELLSTEKILWSGTRKPEPWRWRFWSLYRRSGLPGTHRREDRWHWCSEVVWEYPGSLELCKQMIAEEKICCRRWGALSLWSPPNSPNSLLAELPCFSLEQLSLAEGRPHHLAV